MQTLLKSPDKARAMVDYLQEVIHAGRLKPGERIPPLRNLKDQFGISLGTAKRGIDYLCRKGLLESNRGSGTFVTKKKNLRQQTVETDRIIALIPWLDNTSGILHTLYAGILEASNTAKTELVLSHVGFKGMNIDVLNKMTEGCSALIMLGEYDMVFKKRLNIKMPVVAAGMHNNLDGTASLFEMDPYQSADIAVEYFKKNNISHVKCYAGNNPVGILRIEQFKQQWKKMNGTVEYQVLATHQEVSLHKFKPTGAFLFSSGWMMDAFCKRSIDEFDVSLSESATILGFDGRCCVDPHFEQAPTLYTDWKQMGHDIYLECMRRIKNPGVAPRRHYYPVKLIEPKTNT